MITVSQFFWASLAVMTTAAIQAAILTAAVVS